MSHSSTRQPILTALLFGLLAARGSATGVAPHTPLNYSQILSIPNELVFAYSRVSDDGRFLVYSSQEQARPLLPDRQTLHVYDLTSNKLLYEAPGIDGYWSPDSTQLIFKRRTLFGSVATIWNRLTGTTKDVRFKPEFGDYYSWGRTAGADRIMTINGWFLDLLEDLAAEPKRLNECEGIGRGERPLISRDGTKASVFVGDELVLRSVEDCQWVRRTGIVAAKADWSTDGRFVAFHTPKRSGPGYDLGVYEVETSKFRRLTLSGSSVFPSWTRDGSLMFRYEGDDFQGFMKVSNPLSAPEEKSRRANLLFSAKNAEHAWNKVLDREFFVVMLWSADGAHSPKALTDLATARRELCERENSRCEMLAAHDVASNAAAVQALSKNLANLPVLAASPHQMSSSGAINQNPTYLLFEYGRLISRVLGPMDDRQVKDWLEPFMLAIRRAAG